MKRVLSFALASLAIVSCEKVQTIEKPVVAVGDKVLTHDMLMAAIPPNASVEDSIVLADEYIRRWVNKEVMLQKAHLNLTNEDLDIEAAVEEYRNSLIVERYQQKVVSQKFNPQITEAEIAEYYASMKDNFRLNEMITKGVFAVVPSNVKEIKDFRKMLAKYDDEENYAEMEQFMFRNAVKYEVFADKWTPFSFVKKFLPNTSPIDETKVLKKGKVFEMSDESNVYFVLVTDMCMPDDNAPIEYVNDKIYTILLNKKKIEFIRKINRELYDEALKSNTIKYYIQR